ncbi:hypothetical protein [Vibrio gazogenes]|uniref:Winged helix-turn-helix domain n=1 Tax=Vibrio gazogenes DSM 21264 = NBRC 103151 TaxID=1123492 RepID=A0A1M4TF22_VIBGA|nr:hypothetical protein [Vibrio gazogenes]USP16078.1 hypothetical protein MKS89_16975 [Vibrio gazogenes]SHE42887.1 hypothetical protein SAMN02745781_00299 [Vibrio gazogenes DSM 21264] [Vibrio gazogenes DSM 21264 = NBRC 103151]SJN54248.1 hypothetical protein BQ6471_00905 [Vibrio gazogenes]
MGNNYSCKSDVAVLINDYLKQHPDSEDTILGIRDWWVKQQLLDDSIVAVDNALKFLEKEGKVISTIRNNQVYFRLAKNN